MAAATIDLPQSLRPKSKKTLEAALQTKGWNMINAAQYLGVSRQYLYTQLDAPSRPRLVECAIMGLPQCTDDIAAALKAERDKLKASRPSKPKPSPDTSPQAEPPGRFSVGDGVTADRNVGADVDEGDEGWIVRKFLNETGTLIYVIDFGTKGIESFPDDLANKLFVQNGKTKTL